MDPFLTKLLNAEPSNVVSVMAFMSYNPSIGRVLQKGGVKKFQALIGQIIPKLESVEERKDFDTLHQHCVRCLMRDLKTSIGSRPSYGQIQKPLNVFFKVYIDWASKPNERVRKKLIPHLHVPLDSILMKSIKTEYPDWYKSQIKPYICIKQQEFSLSKIDKILYLKWQDFFRSKNPQKPLLFDIAWAMNRVK